MEDVKCSVCNKQIIREKDSISTGYGVNREGQKICFACCGDLDKKELIETGKLIGYLSKGKDERLYFTNWPGTLKIHVYYTKKSNHNFAGYKGRTDFWCMFEGQHYWGVSIGDNDIARLKRIKNE